MHETVANLKEWPTYERCDSPTVTKKNIFTNEKMRVLYRIYKEINLTYLFGHIFLFNKKKSQHKSGHRRKGCIM